MRHAFVAALVTWACLQIVEHYAAVDFPLTVYVVVGFVAGFAVQERKWRAWRRQRAEQDRGFEQMLHNIRRGSVRLQLRRGLDVALPELFPARGSLFTVAVAKGGLMTQKRKPVKLEQMELLQEFVKRGVNAQRAVDTIVKQYEDAGLVESRADADRRLKNLRAARRRRGRSEPD